jgi:phosphoribosylformylglycinamidine synthase
MAFASGLGAEVALEDVPLKEEGLLPWEIWVSESQERMMLSVRPDKLEEVLTIFRLYDVPATPIGRVIREPVVRVSYRGHRVLELDLDFLTRGPEYCRPYSTLREERVAIPPQVPEPDDYSSLVLGLLASPNVASKEWVIRQYDHEVKASTVIKPLHGRIGKAAHGDAAVIKPLQDSWRGLAIAVASAPQLCALDPFRGGASVVDELCRNITSVGGRPDAMSDCLNFGNPEKPDRMGAFREVVRGMAEVAEAVGLAIPSGNVSFYNESPLGPVPPTPVALGVGIVEDIRRCITSDFKVEGNPIYLVGRTSGEMGGSEYHRLRGFEGGAVPPVDCDLLRLSLPAIVEAIRQQLVVSAHDPSHGGIAVAFAEMALGGDLGFAADLRTVGDLRSDAKLFAESNTRWLLEVRREAEGEFRKALADLPLHRVGTVGGKSLLFRDGGLEFDLGLDEVRRAWNGGMVQEVGP